MDAIEHYDAVDVFIGVDVGKGEHHAVALSSAGKRLFDKALPNDETRLRALVSSLKEHGKLLLVVDQPTTIPMRRTLRHRPPIGRHLKYSSSPAIHPLRASSRTPTH